MALLQYVLNNPKTVAMALAALVGLAVVVGLSLTVEAIPVWIGFLGLSALPGYAAWLQWGRLSLLFHASEVPAGRVSPGVVEVSGTARAAREGDRVTPDDREGEYLAYKRIERVDRDPGDNDELPFLEKEAAGGDVAAVPIYVEDDTGAALVDANDADVRLSWDDTHRSNRRTTKWAGLEPGDQVTVYGTAVPPGQRQPSGVVDRISDLDATVQGRGFDELAAEEDVVVTHTPRRPYLILSDRSGLGLLGRQLGYFLLAAGLTVALLAVSVLAMIGRPVV